MFPSLTWELIGICTVTCQFTVYTFLCIETPFNCSTALIIYGLDSTRCWKHFSQFAPYWHDCIIQLLQIFIHNANPLFHHIPKALNYVANGGHLNTLNPLSVNQFEMIELRVDQQYLKYSDQSICHQQPCHVQSHRNHLSSSFWCLELLPSDWLDLGVISCTCCSRSVLAAHW